MARTVWANATLSADTDLTPIEAGVASFGVGSLSDKHTLAKNEIARLLRLRLSEYKSLVNSVETQTDGSVVASGTTFSSAAATFTTKKVTTSHKLWITAGADKGVYTFTGVTATTLTGCSPAFTATSGSLSYYIEADVLDLIKNPTILTPAAAFLVLHYCALELVQAVGDFWDMKKDYYRHRFEETYKELVPDLLLDTNQDDVITTGERHMGISGGSLIR